jgi:hypothetical protein
MAPAVSKEQKWAYGWHWRPEDGSLKHSDYRHPKVGERLVAKGMRGGKPRWCKAGFHAAPTIDDSLKFKNYGPLLSYVLMEDCQFYSSVWGHREKFTASARTILWERRVPFDVAEAGAESIRSWLRRCGFKAENVQARGRRLRAKFPKQKNRKKTR